MRVTQTMRGLTKTRNSYFQALNEEPVAGGYVNLAISAGTSSRRHRAAEDEALYIVAGVLALYVRYRT